MKNQTFRMTMLFDFYGNHDMSISKVIDPHQKISALLEKHKND